MDRSGCRDGCCRPSWIERSTERRRDGGGIVRGFTEREEEVLQQLVLARSNREIAQALSIREQTVKSYVARLMRKVGVGNRIALSVQAASGAWGEKDS
jgi:DNA-binding NarL/FixJ family response regulator